MKEERSMTEQGRGVIMQDTKEPSVSGYLIIGSKHYEIYGHRVSAIRTNLQIREINDGTEAQEDLFDERSSQSGERKRDLV